LNNFRYDTSTRKKVKFTNKITERIKFYLRKNEAKRAEGRAKQQKRKIDIDETLRGEGFDIGYITVCRPLEI